MSSTVLSSTVNDAAAFRQLASHCNRLGIKEAATLAARMADDVECAQATILVCGEFKRGKTSLVNALLGTPILLPVDIRPATAVIHVIREGDPGINVHWRDGKTSSHPLDSGFLKQFATQESGGASDPETVEYVEVFLRNPLLKNGLVIVDTPGTNDLSQTRSEIVYRMIPRADAVLFVLDATTQITSTEAAFLRDRLLSSIAPPLCFVLNKLDRVEEEEHAELQEATDAAIRQHVPVTDLHLTVASATDKKIGVQNIHDFLTDFMAGGERQKAAKAKKARVFVTLQKYVLEVIEAKRTLCSATVGDLKKALAQSETDRSQLGDRIRRFSEYLLTCGSEALIPMVRQSFRSHSDDMSRKLIADAKCVGNPAMYANNQLPLHIEAGFKQWLDRKLPELANFTSRYQAAMLQEYHRTFGDRTVSGLRPDSGLSAHLGQSSTRVELDLGIPDPDSKETLLIRAGLPAAGALIMATVASAGTALIVGSLAGALLGAGIAKQRLEAARETLANQIPGILQTHGGQFLEQITSEIRRFFNDFSRQLESLAHEEAERRENDIRDALANLEKTEKERSFELRQLQQLHQEVESMRMPAFH